MDFIWQQGGIVESSEIVRKCSSDEDINGDKMGTMDQSAVHRNLDQLESVQILTLEIKKTIGGKEVRYYRLNLPNKWGLTPERGRVF